MILYISLVIIMLVFCNFSHTRAWPAVGNDPLDCNLKSHLYNSRLLLFIPRERLRGPY